jgi:hypothetical protein
VDIVKRKKAPAIKVNQSEIVLLKPDLSAVCIYNNPKDFWPYYLCNLGNIYVTSKQHLSPYLATYNIANTKNNMCTEIRSLQEIEELITLNT